MNHTTATGHLDADGEEFMDDSLYLDGYGDTWKYLGGIESFLHVKRGDEETPATGPNVFRSCEDAVTVARDFGPMTKVTEVAR